jgi:hypothetical protein
MRITALVISLTLLSATTASAQVPRLEPVTRIGCVDCDGPTLFAGIQGLAVQGNRIYVLDTAAPYVRVFDSNGRVVRAFAREGSGPGELRLPIAVAPRAHGELEIFDMRLRRFTRFDSTGKSLGTRMPNGFTALVASAPGSAHVWLLQTDFTTPDQPVLKFSDNAAEPAKLITLNAQFPKLEPGELARTPSIAADPRGGIAIGDGVAEYRIRRYDANGRSLGDIVRDIPKQRKTAAELEAERARMQRRAARVAQMIRAEGGTRAPTFTPREERNHFNMSALAYDETGRLWVRTERGGLNATIFDLFDVNGRYTGEVRVAMRVGPFALDSGHLVGRVTDDEEVEFIQVWRLR